ncbi:hypothetical protein [Streptomyces rochei]|uniref:hypothetical protein n=1 Tax=Streptomyces rochei TaxID=1928 RepID=UPI0033A60E22
MLFTPAVHFAAPVQVGSETEHIKLPLVLNVLRVITLTGLDTLLPVTATTGQALAQHPIQP